MLRDLVMRPLSLKGHERALTRVRINRDGDLLFSAAKDKSPCVWYTENGERIGTYDGHNGVIWDIDVSWDTRNLCSASGDSSVKLWDCEHGKSLGTINTPTVARSISISYSGNLLAFTTIKMTHNMATLYVYDIRDSAQIEGESLPALKHTLVNQANACVWTHLDDTLCIGTEKGNLQQYDIRKGEMSNFNESAHKLQVHDMQVNSDQSFIITASKDKTAKLFNARTLDCLKAYRAERPVNSAAISPTHDHVILGGGEEAMNVTQTARSSGHFEAKLYHLVFEEEFARFKGHFGPINTLAFHPSGNGVVSGGEDGYIRIQEFDSDYSSFVYDC
uniref:Eukaryotic translation initiation factor 3 subunit I n=1 Tax=Ascaris lumbricoides TaxID=6252 RepID=A0A0M3HT81_ASCLU